MVHPKTIKWNSTILLFIVMMFVKPYFASGQPETMAWGNLNGIRYQGELITFESSLAVIGSSLMDISQTAKEQQSPRYQREGNTETVTTALGDISFTEIIKNLGDGAVEINIESKADADTAISGVFFCLELPANEFTDLDIQLIDSTASTLEPIAVFPDRRGRRFNMNTQALAKGARIVSTQRRIEITTNEPTEILVQQPSRFMQSANPRVYLAIQTGAAVKDQTVKKTFTLRASGTVDNTPVRLAIDTTRPGRKFNGIGGNFRLQNPETDPQVINYCLDNLNVTWGRVEMPWNSWHPVESENPILAARAGNIAPNVEQAMLMAQRLSKLGMPVIVSAWFPPAWAIEGQAGFGRQNGIYGNPLNQDKMKSIIKSLGSYLVYLKEAYGVEAVMFSFNESDLGINVRQTGQEHADLIKTLGAYMASQGLATKMLLGDNSDANTYSFIEEAMADAETHKYIGAVSFHSWRGCDDWTLSIWADAAKELNVPLLVGEGSTDAAAHRYPEIFLQPVYSLGEIDTYVRIMDICQPASILQWQLTADYSVLTGAGIYRSTGKLRPTQRFWNLKQMGLTPSGSFHLPMTCDRPNISCAAFADVADGIYTVHLVNNGATRIVTLEGLPKQFTHLQIYTTDSKRGMQKGKRIGVTDGVAQFEIEAASFTSVVSE